MFGPFLSIDPCWILSLPVSVSISTGVWRQNIYSTLNTQEENHTPSTENQTQTHIFLHFALSLSVSLGNSSLILLLDNCGQRMILYTTFQSSVNRNITKGITSFTLQKFSAYNLVMIFPCNHGHIHQAIATKLIYKKVTIYLISNVFEFMCII